MEIDDYQNYEKALDALSEAFKCISKAKDSSSAKQEARLADLQHKITLIKKFVQARRWRAQITLLFCCLSECILSVAFGESLSLSLQLPLAGCMRRMQARRCGCVRPYWTSQIWTLLSGLETRTALWWNITANKETSKWWTLFSHFLK